MKTGLKLAGCWLAFVGTFLTGVVVLGTAVLVGAQAPVTPQNPLRRQYVEGQALKYHMTGINENWHYAIDAVGQVKKDAGGVFYEEYQWENMVSDGQPIALTGAADYRQRLSLDPARNPSAPDLAKVDPKMIGPITDLMTFYVDLWLPLKLGVVRKAGDHFLFRNPMPVSSWADGTRVLIGEDAIDFDITLKAVDAAAGTATLVVKHVPPEKAAVKLPAAWMQTAVGDAPNNWVEVQKEQNGTYTAAVGEETFTVEMKVSLADGKILGGTLNNPVKTVARVCEDEALTKCGDAKPHEILRKIEISLVQ